MKKRKLIFLIFVIALFAGVISRIAYVNITAEPLNKVYYEMGETVEFTDDYIFNPSDSLKGYTINIKSTSLISSEDYMEKYGISEDDFPFSEEEIASYVIDLEAEISNIDSEKRINPTFHTVLVTESNTLTVEQNLFGAMYEQNDLVQTISLEKGESMTYHIPYCYNGAENIPFFDTYEFLKNSKYLYLISQYPTERYINVTVKDET